VIRKRAPGGGRKPSPSPARPLTTRIDDNLRRRLEAATRDHARQNPRWNISREIARRLEWSFDKEREERRSPAIAAICFLIADLAARELHTDRWQSWHRNPFAFAAFKDAVAELLNYLTPPGDVQPPAELAPVIAPLGAI